MATYKLKIVQKLSLEKLTPENLEYYCISDDIDREVMKRRGKTYDENLAFNMLYFIVTKDKRIAVLPVFRDHDHIFDFEDWLKKYGIKSIEKSKAAEDAIDWFIEVVHGYQQLS